MEAIMADKANNQTYQDLEAATPSQCWGVAMRYSSPDKKKKGSVDYVARNEKECEALGVTQDPEVHDALHRMFLVMSNMEDDDVRLTHGDIQYLFRHRGQLDQDLIDNVKVFLERPELGENLKGGRSLSSRRAVGTSKLADALSAWGSESAEEVPF
jgi:hypothetical protein